VSGFIGGSANVDDLPNSRKDGVLEQLKLPIGIP
jgi:hypothetical protein